MLKQFLKFLRGDGKESNEFDQGYLKELLRGIQPGLVEKLDACPEHDPLPLLVAEMMRKVDQQRFATDLKGPVTDAQSPPLERREEPNGEDSTETIPPPPPGADSEAEAPGAEADRSEEEVDDSGRVADEESEATDGSGGGSDGGGARPRDDETSGDGEEAEEFDDSNTEVEDEDDETEAAGREDDQISGGDDVEAADGAETTESEDSGGDSADEDAEQEAVSVEAADGGEEGGDAAENRAPSNDTDEFFATDEEDTDVQYEGATTVERTANRVSQRAGRVVEQPDEEPLPSVDSEIVLEMGRVFLGMLVENDALPVELQLNAEEIGEARRLLYGYFLGDDLVDDRAREMLRLVEEKFDEGMFSQARILLQLFDADKQTRIENDRNLFYEEMILRFGIQRRHPVADEVAERFSERVDRYDGSDEKLLEFFVWLSQSIYVTFNLYGRNERDVEEWREIAGLSERPGAADRLLDVIPPRRWRLLDEFRRPAAAILEERLTADFLEDYVTEQVKTCYFILRAVGDTGLEPYLDVFFDWVDEAFGVDGPALMPPLYTETTANERLIDDIFHELYVEEFASEAESICEEWEADVIEEAVDDVVERIGSTDLGDIPPGHYDLGRLVLDELFGLEYPADDLPFKMHRIT